MRWPLLCLFFAVFATFSAAQSAPAAKRGLFVSIVQDPPLLESRQRITALIEFAKRKRIDTLFVQVYNSNRSWFASKIADDTPYQKCRKLLSADPLQLLIEQAHHEGIQVHAWMNLMSLGSNAGGPFVRKYGPAILTTNLSPKKKLLDYKIDGQYFLEPGDLRVRNDLEETMTELLQAYPDLDGVQFDYIRYPDVDPHYGYTAVNIQRYKQATSQVWVDDQSRLWQNWKRDQVTQTVAALAKKARLLHPHIQISTTGCMPYARALYEAYQDWPSWVSKGLTDFVTVMDYSEDPVEFERWIRAIQGKVTDFSKVRIAVGAYKFVHSPQVFGQEWQRCEGLAQGCTVFHYGSLLENSGFETAL